MKTRLRACALAAIFLPGLLAAQEQAKLVPALGWDSATQGAFVTSVVLDAQNNVWAGTEGKGLWRYDSRAKKWTQFTVNDGLGDDYVYALAVDKLGRVWAGHLNHGVSVWNGDKWNNYGLLDGPLGDRVFSIATCPTDGDVWIATDCGAARYSLAKDDWDYFTRASGLPSNQIQAIAFDSKGNLFLGTQCDGIAMSTAEGGYKKWKTVTGPQQTPNAASGEGLSCNLINDVEVVHALQQNGMEPEAIVAATPVGLSLSPNGGQNWLFVRGVDWQANVNGLYNPPAPSAAGNGLPQVPQNQLLMEDWVTCVRQDENTKNFWVGYRTKGIEVRGTQSDKIITQAGADSDSFFVRAICLPQKGPPLIAVGDINTGGLLTLDSSKDELAPGAAPPKTAPPLPGTPKATDAATFAALAKQLDVFKNELKPGDAVYLGDDWRTQGDWVGRYGGSFAMLCGLDEGGIYRLEPDYDVSVGLGVHNKGGPPQPGPQAHIANATSNDVRVLYSPTLGHRSEAELNDLSCFRADYPPEWEGPDLWVDVKVPDGIQCLSLYFTNNDEQGDDPGNKLRDYDVQVLTWGKDKDAVQQSAPLARARVTDFQGGVYKMFVVSGPARYIVRVGRNHSFGTKLQGVFIDALSNEENESRKRLPGFDTLDYVPAALEDKSVLAADPILSAASDLWDLLDQSFGKRGVAGLQFPLRIAAYRAAVAGHAPAALLDPWRWQMAIWTKEDRDGFDKAMAVAFKAVSGKQPPPANQDGN